MGTQRGGFSQNRKDCGKEGSGNLKKLRLDQWTLKQKFDSQVIRQSSEEAGVPAGHYIPVLSATILLAAAETQRGARTSPETHSERPQQVPRAPGTGELSIQSPGCGREPFAPPERTTPLGAPPRTCCSGSTHSGPLPRSAGQWRRSYKKTCSALLLGTEWRNRSWSPGLSQVVPSAPRRGNPAGDAESEHARFPSRSRHSYSHDRSAAMEPSSKVRITGLCAPGGDVLPSAGAGSPSEAPRASRGRPRLHAVGAGAADQGLRNRTSHTTSAAPPARGRGPERGAHWLRGPSPRPGPGWARRRRDPPEARAAPGTRALGVARRRRHFLQAWVGGLHAAQSSGDVGPFPQASRCLNRISQYL
ncbi:hypothetical protein ACRRTK_016723 [Alexandromys fortis]